LFKEEREKKSEAEERRKERKGEEVWGWVIKLGRIEVVLFEFLIDLEE